MTMGFRQPLVTILESNSLLRFRSRSRHSTLWIKERQLSGVATMGHFVASLIHEVLSVYGEERDINTVA